MTVVDADALGKSFGRVRVLRDLTLRVDGGDTVALFGPNGAGKSTLLRICATLYAPTAGTLALFGSRRRSAEIRRRIGLLSHQSFLYPDLSARENLVFYGRLYGLARPEHVADAWLERVGLAASANRTVRVFSRGMEQRLALARTLLHDPELLLLDEPWSALDAAGADLLSELLEGLRAEGRTILVATHDFERGVALAERAVILHGGRVVWEASPSDATVSVEAAYRQVTGAVAA
jgi:heme exporter protein A